jgi:hypothetical protein
MTTTTAGSSYSGNLQLVRGLIRHVNMTSTNSWEQLVMELLMHMNITATKAGYT